MITRTRTISLKFVGFLRHKEVNQNECLVVFESNIHVLLDGEALIDFFSLAVNSQYLVLGTIHPDQPKKVLVLLKLQKINNPFEIDLVNQLIHKQRKHQQILLNQLTVAQH